MKFFKTLLIKLLLNKRQRNTIWQALIFSEHKYRQHGNIDSAVAVQVVINEVEEKLGVIPQTFTKSDVDNIVNNLISDSKKCQESAYLQGIQDGKKQAYDELKSIPEVSTGLVVGTIIDPEKCKACECKKDCIVGSAVIEEENSKVEQNNTVSSDVKETSDLANQE